MFCFVISSTAVGRRLDRACVLCRTGGAPRRVNLSMGSSKGRDAERRGRDFFVAGRRSGIAGKAEWAIGSNRRMGGTNSNDGALCTNHISLTLCAGRRPMLWHRRCMPKSTRCAYFLLTPTTHVFRPLSHRANPVLLLAQVLAVFRMRPITQVLET